VHLALITPIPLLDRFRELMDPYHLVLAHLCRDPRYLDFYCQRAADGDEVILDNSVHEGHNVDLVDLIGLTHTLSATTVVLPDTPYQAARTVQQARQYYQTLRTALPGVKLMAVPHGSTYLGFGACVSQLVGLGVDSIGLVRDCTCWYTIRAYLIPHLRHVLQPTQTLHLLGGESQPVEVYLLGLAVKMARTPDPVHGTSLTTVGIDTSKPLVLAHHGICLSDKLLFDNVEREIDWNGRPVDYFELDNIDYDLAKENIRVYRAWLDGEVGGLDRA